MDARLLPLLVYGMFVCVGIGAAIGAQRPLEAFLIACVGSLGVRLMSR